MSHARDWQRRSQEPHWPLAGIGHNAGPPLDEEPPGKLLLVRHHWHRAHKAARAVASMDIVRFRVRRAEAAGVGYDEYVSELLDSGRHLQREDVAAREAGKARAGLDRPRQPRT
jgi:hypothetical protein